MVNYRLLEESSYKRDQRNWPFIVYSLFLCILSLFFISNSFSHHYIIEHNDEHNEHADSVASSRPITHLLWTQNANCTEAGRSSLTANSQTETLALVEQCQMVKGESYVATNETIQLGNYQVEILSGTLGDQLTSILLQLQNGRTKRHAGHHHNIVNYELLMHAVASLQPHNHTSFDIDHSVIVANGATGEITFSRDPAHTVAAILHGETKYFIMGFGGRAVERLLQSILDIVLWGGNIESTQKGLIHVMPSGDLCRDETVIADELGSLVECDPTISMSSYLKAFAIHGGAIDIGHDSNLTPTSNLLLL